MRYVFVQRFGSNQVGFRLIGDSFPKGYEKIKIDLSATEHGGCLVPLNELWNHDTHSQAFTEDGATKYIARVVQNIVDKLAACKGEETPVTSYQMIDLAGIKPHPVKKTTKKTVMTKATKKTGVKPPVKTVVKFSDLIDAAAKKIKEEAS